MKREEMVKASQNRDKSYTGQFFLAVRSTKIVCNPGCSSKVPLEKNMVFYDTLEEALADGYRPCKVCMKQFWKLGPADGKTLPPSFR